MPFAGNVKPPLRPYEWQQATRVCLIPSNAAIMIRAYNMKKMFREFFPAFVLFSCVEITSLTKRKNDYNNLHDTIQ